MKSFFKQSPRRDEVDAGDRIELLHLETREIVSGVELQRRIKQNEECVTDLINLPVLLPFLQKKQIISYEESKSLERADPDQQNTRFLNLLETKDPQLVEKFVECLKESPEHGELYDILGK